jgi:hypothetical protein
MKVLCTNTRCEYVGHPRYVNRPKLAEGIYLDLSMSELRCACGRQLVDVSNMEDAMAERELEVERAAMDRDIREDTENGIALKELREWVNLLEEVMKERLGEGLADSVLDDVERRFAAGQDADVSKTLLT